MGSALLTAARVLVFGGLLGVLGALAAEPARSAGGRDENYRLRPMDLVRLQVFQEPDLEREFRVAQDQTITVPLVGNVKLEGRTLRDTERLLTDLYRRNFLKNPQISLTVVDYAPRTVNVLGAVNSPCAVALPPEKEFGLLDAIARAGGFSRLANRTKVILTVARAGGGRENIVINVDALVVGENQERWILADGDVVYVPERML